MTEYIISNLHKDLQSIANNIDAKNNGGNDDHKISGDEVKKFENSVWQAYYNNEITADVAKTVCDAAKVDALEEKRNPSLWKRAKSGVKQAIKDVVTDTKGYYYVAKEGFQTGGLKGSWKAIRYYNNLDYSRNTSGQTYNREWCSNEARLNVEEGYPRYYYEKNGNIRTKWYADSEEW